MSPKVNALVSSIALLFICLSLPACGGEESNGGDGTENETDTVGPDIESSDVEQTDTDSSERPSDTKETSQPKKDSVGDETESGDIAETTEPEDILASETEQADTGETENVDAAEGETDASGEARMMLLHTAADPALAQVDIFVDGELFADNFEFRTALPFADISSGSRTVTVASADAATEGEDSSLESDDTVYEEFSPQFTDGKTYIAALTGVRAGESFRSNPDGRDIGISLELMVDGRETSSGGSSSASVALFNGVTDLQTVDGRLDNESTATFRNLNYSAFSEYTSVTASRHMLDIEPGDNSSRISSYQTRVFSGGEAWIIAATGFIDPVQNQNGESLSLVAFPAKTSQQTDVVEGQPLQKAARIQLIHSAPEERFSPADIYDETRQLKLADDLAYQSATDFMTVPAGIDLDIGIASENSSSSANTIRSSSFNFEHGATTYLIASGVTDASSFESVSSPNFAFRSGNSPVGGPNEATIPGSDVQLNVSHVATDLPAIDVLAGGGAITVLTDLGFGESSGEFTVPAIDYTLDLRNTRTRVPLEAFDLSFSGTGGSYRTIVASGFLTAQGDPVDSETFQLLSIAPDGSVTSVRPN
jgi:hypothetical protein